MSYKRLNIIIMSIIWSSLIFSSLTQGSLKSSLVYFLPGAILALALTVLIFIKRLDYLTAYFIPIGVVLYSAFIMYSTKFSVVMLLVLFMSITIATLYHKPSTVVTTTLMGAFIQLFLFIFFKNSVFQGQFGTWSFVIMNVVLYAAFGTLSFIQSSTGKKMRLILEEKIKLAEDANTKIQNTLNAVTNTGGEVGRLVDALNAKSMKLIDMSNTVAAAMSETSKGIEDENKDIQQSVEILNTLVEKMEHVAEMNSIMAENSSDSKEIADLGRTKIEDVSHHIDMMMNSISNLSNVVAAILGYSSQIGKTLEVMNNITKETRLLSLNASIEAAKAQEYGKGFSIVAMNIMKLSDLMDKFSKEISGVIHNINSNVIEAGQKSQESVKLASRGLEISKEAREAFYKIHKYVDDISIESCDVDSENQDVAKRAHEVLDKFCNIMGVIEQSSATVEQVSSTASLQVDYVKESIEQLELVNDKVKQLHDYLYKSQ